LGQVIQEEKDTEIASKNVTNITQKMTAIIRELICSLWYNAQVVIHFPMERNK
jgi:hypothetical protein